MDYIILALIAAIFFGISEIIKKKTLKKETAYEFLTLLYIFCFIIILPFYRNLSLNLPPLILFMILVRSFLFLIAVICFTKALKHLPISTVSPLSSIGPIFAAILGFLILNERVSTIQIIGIAIIVMGAYILKSENHIKNYHKPLHDLIKSKYTHYIILYALFSSITSILSKKILIDISSYNLIFYHYLFSMIMYLVILFFFKNGIKDMKEGWKLGGHKILLIAILGTIASYVSFLSFASIDSKVMVIVPILQLAILIDVIAGGRLFHEKYLKTKIIGSVVIIVGILLTTLF
jgi:drug/metabolite transporter (DMT)-like permease